VAQAPPSSRHRRLANSRTIHPSIVVPLLLSTITTTMPPPAPIRATGRSEIWSRFTTDSVSYHSRDCVDKIYPAYFLLKIDLWPVFYHSVYYHWPKMQLPDATLYLLNTSVTSNHRLATVYIISVQLKIYNYDITDIAICYGVSMSIKIKIALLNIKRNATSHTYTDCYKYTSNLWLNQVILFNKSSVSCMKIKNKKEKNLYMID